MPFYLTPEQDDFNKIPELQACIAEALHDVDSIVADVPSPGVSKTIILLGRYLFLNLVGVPIKLYTDSR